MSSSEPRSPLKAEEALDERHTTGGNQGSSTARHRERIRTGHACEPCRKRRAKCNGAQPHCARCEELSIPCYYAESKAQRHQKEKYLSSKAATYESILRSLIPKQDLATQREIEAALNESSARDRANASEEKQDEIIAAGEAGSLHNAASTSELSPFEGYLGKSSSVRWLSDIGQKFDRESENPPDRTHTKSNEKSKIEGLLLDAATYHVNEFEENIFTNLAAEIDIRALPSKQVADNYLLCYMETVHPFFQVVHKQQFLEQYARFWSTGVPPEGGPIWQALLNLIFALGCVYAKYTGRQGPDASEEVQFFLRARMLSLEPLSFLQVPDKQHVQLSTMFAMYLLASNRINRAWLMIGTSSRYAQNLAYHLDNVSDSISEFEKETHKRLWHSITSLEHILCFLTGRPMSIWEGVTSVGLPSVIDKPSMDRDRSNQNTRSQPRFEQAGEAREIDMFRNGVLLDRVLAETLTQLYNASTVSKSWAEIQQMVSNLNIKLAAWKAYLPSQYGLMDIDQYPQLDRAALQSTDVVYLALRYFSVGVLINRLSLCSRPDSIRVMPDQSQRSRDVDSDNAKRAIRAAQGIIWLLQNRPRPELCDQTPWWCVLHFIVQACALLIMELYDNAEHVTEGAAELTRDARSGLKLLAAFRGSNPAAKKAYESLTRLLDLASSQRQDHHHHGLSRSGPHQEGMGGMGGMGGVDESTSHGSTSPMEWERGHGNGGGGFGGFGGGGGGSGSSSFQAVSAFNLLHGPRLSGITPTLSPFVHYSPPVSDEALSISKHARPFGAPRFEAI